MQVERPVAGPIARPGLADTPTTWRVQLAILAVVVLLVVAFVVGVLVPYVVNDLHRIPSQDLTTGAYDPKDLWPAASGYVGAVIRLAGLFVVTLGQLLLIVLTAAVAWTVFPPWRVTTWPARIIGCASLLLCVAMIVTLWSPWGRDITVWILD